MPITNNNNINSNINIFENTEQFSNFSNTNINNINNTNNITNSFFSTFTCNFKYTLKKLKQIFCEEILFFTSIFAYCISLNVVTYLTDLFYINATFNVAYCSIFLITFSNFSSIIELAQNYNNIKLQKMLNLKLLITFILTYF